jgi:serine/threonine protein kinase
MTAPKPDQPRADSPPRSGTKLPGAKAPAPSGPPPDLPPELAKHPRYLILRELGRGGMGVVYQARQTVMNRPVVIKVINKVLLDQPDALERFHREVRAAAKLAHPNIVTAYDAEQAGDLHMLVMEFVPGQSLEEVLRKKGLLPVAQACSYIRQAALGLQHAHKQGMVHRDIKPQNLMLTPQGQVKILDFGLARIASERSQGGALTAANAYMGTPDYSSPEQATDARTADIRADLYSLGCTLYCLLAGRPPFQEDTAVKTILAHLEKEPQPLPELRPDVPAALWAVVARLLAKEPKRRYQTPAEVAQALTPFGKPGGKTATVPPAVASPAQATVLPRDTTRLPGAAGKAPTRPAVPVAELVSASTSARRSAPPRRGPMLAGAVAVLATLVVAVGLGAWLLVSGVFKPKAQSADPVAPPAVAQVQERSRAPEPAPQPTDSQPSAGPSPAEPSKEPAPAPSSSNLSPPPPARPMEPAKEPAPTPGHEPAGSSTPLPSGGSPARAPAEPKQPNPQPEAGTSRDVSPEPAPAKTPADVTPTPPTTPPSADKVPPAVEPDLIQEALDRARTTYKEETEKWRQTVRDYLDKREETARKDGKKDLLDQVKADREAFAARGELPRSMPAAAYRRGLKTAAATMEAAYNTAIKEYIKARKDERAQDVEQELKRFQTNAETKPVPKKPYVAAVWVHEVRMNGKVVGRSTHKMYSNGHINSPDSPATWTLQGNVLILRWPNPRAPGGAWEDVCNISADGMAYVGKNQQGATIAGVRIANGDPEKKP